jgi:hypothetical protein
VGGFKKEGGTFSLSFKGDGGLFIIPIRSCKTAGLIVFASASFFSCTVLWTSDKEWTG